MELRRRGRVGLEWRRFLRGEWGRKWRKGRTWGGPRLHARGSVEARGGSGVVGWLRRPWRQLELEERDDRWGPRVLCHARNFYPKFQTLTCV
uniref:Uncharacterized protein n=1 Tax=Oryza sativa subsp. japonica TaxID=39947 RepID=Q5VNE8_ORYSJ|nr:hypothetical protein [Oryza sativa Japonica Group]